MFVVIYSKKIYFPCSRSFEVLAIDFLPVKKLINEDFPTFDLPEKQISIKLPSGIS